MFEIFKPRSEKINQDIFTQFLNDDKEFADLVKTFMEEMEFSGGTDEYGNDSGDDMAAERETQPGYSGALSAIQRWLDRKGHRITTRGIEVAVVTHMDPHGKNGFLSLI